MSTRCTYELVLMTCSCDLSLSSAPVYSSYVLSYFTSGARAILEWNGDGGASASSYRYSFEPLLVIKVGHHVGDVLSGASRLGFEGAVDLDE